MTKETADELHALAVRTRDAARLAERHGTSTHGYRRAAREACERMGEMAADIEPLRANFLGAMDRLRAAERERDEAHLAIDQALCGGMEDLERQLAEAEARLATIVDEGFGPQPVMTLDELLTTLERRVSEVHIETEKRLGTVARERDEAREVTAGALCDRDDLVKQRDRLMANIADVQRLRNGAEVALSRAIERQGALNGDIRGARTELRDLVAALGQDDGPRAKAIQHARAVLEEWGMR